MKKYLIALLTLIPLLAFTACDDDDNLPNVDFDLTIDGAVNVDGTLYVVRGETLTVESITVINKDGGGAFITSASYYWNGYFLGRTVQPPFGFEIETNESTRLGRSRLEIYAPLFASDKTLANAFIQYGVTVVESSEDIPGADNGVRTLRVTPAISTDDK